MCEIDTHQSQVVSYKGKGSNSRFSVLINSNLMFKKSDEAKRQIWLHISRANLVSTVKRNSSDADFYQKLVDNCLVFELAREYSNEQPESSEDLAGKKELYFKELFHKRIPNSTWRSVLSMIYTTHSHLYDVNLEY